MSKHASETVCEVICIYCSKALPCGRSITRRHLRECASYKRRSVEGRVIADE